MRSKGLIGKTPPCRRRLNGRVSESENCFFTHPTLASPYASPSTSSGLHHGHQERGIERLKILNGPITYASLVFVGGQITWTSIIGLLYGYMFLRTGNLYANMLLHWTANSLGNCFMYLPYVSPEFHALFNIVFNIGIMSTIISILWVVLVNRLWPLEKQKPISDMHCIS